MADLRTNYQDDVLDASKNTARVYDLVDSNGTVVLAGVHLEDKTVYTTEGDDYGAADINTQNGKINELSNDLSDIFNTTKQSFSGSGTVDKILTMDEDKIINITCYSTTRGTPYVRIYIAINDEIMVENSSYGSTYPDNNNSNCTLLKKVKAGDVIKISCYTASGTTTYNIVSNLTF